MGGNKRKNERYLYMIPSEAETFVRVAYDLNARWGLMWDLTWKGGLRVSEVLALMPSDFNFQTNMVSIATLKREGHPRIDILYPPQTIQIAQKIIEHYEVKPTDRIFPIARAWAWHQFKRVLKKANMNMLYSPHALRHSHGLVVREIVGGDLTKIAKRLRHASPNNSWRYMHLTDQDQQDIVNYFNKDKNKKQGENK